MESSLGYIKGGLLTLVSRQSSVKNAYVQYHAAKSALAASPVVNQLSESPNLVKSINIVLL